MRYGRQLGGVTLADINKDIITLTGTSDAKDYVSVVSFPCMTESSRSVSFGGQLFPSLEKIRFAILKAGALNVRTT